MEDLTQRDRVALRDAAYRSGGWGLFFPKTTAKLAERGLFERAEHPSYGERWRITDAGRDAVAQIVVR